MTVVGVGVVVWPPEQNIQLCLAWQLVGVCASQLLSVSITVNSSLGCVIVTPHQRD